MKLAIDTSTETASIALIHESQVLAELTWHCGQNHTTELLPYLTLLLEKTKVSLQSTQCIIVAKGPGSFNGLRVGMATAKGLALSLGVPIIGISTLEADAYQHAETGLPICPIFNAGREEVATAVYQMKGSKWLQLTPEHITTLDALCSEISKKTVFCGEYIAEVATELKRRLKQKAVITSPAARLRRASFLAELGQKRLEAGDVDNISTLQPIYLRKPPITKPKKQH